MNRERNPYVYENSQCWSALARHIIEWKQWHRYLWDIGACAPSSFGNSVHSAAAAILTAKISKITKEKHVLNFHLSRQKHAKTHVNRLNCQKKPRAGEERKHLCFPPHLISCRRH